jgi:nickel transport protein
LINKPDQKVRGIPGKTSMSKRPISMIKRLAATLTAVLAASTLVAPLIANAHDAWVAPVDGPIFPIHFGHKGPQDYVAAKVKTVTVFDANRATLASEISRDDKGASVKPNGKPAMLLVEFDNGFYTKIDGKSVQMSKRDAPAGSVTNHPVKSGKTIVQWMPWMTEAVGQRLEVVPINASAAPTAGSKFQVRVLLDGKPIAGLMVENNSNETGPKTDAQGLATLTLVKGINRLAVDHDIPMKGDPDTDKLGLNASLVFMAK